MVRLGQNFLADPNLLDAIVRDAALSAKDVVLEVGAGEGVLSERLAAVAAHLHTVEVDRNLEPALAPLGARDNVSLHWGDAMKLDLAALRPAPTAMVANLPYNVAVPVLLHLLATVPSLRSVLVLVQLEVAERLAAGPGSKVYGIPSVKARWYGTATLAGRIGRNVFWPAPNVDSGLVRLVRSDPPGDDALRLDTFAVVDAAFGQRRKTLRSSLSRLTGSTGAAEAALVAAGVDPGLRGEVLELEQFVAIARTWAAQR